jgi:hypothetical protein
MTDDLKKILDECRRKRDRSEEAADMYRIRHGGKPTFKPVIIDSMKRKRICSGGQ